jgi:hypothetical protein
MSVDPVARADLGSAPEADECGRPEYPAPAIDWLKNRVKLERETTVVDLAAGTGKLSRPLAAMGARVVAVEPVDVMRAAIGPGIEAIEGRRRRSR